MNPFTNWTQADVDAQNRKAAGVINSVIDEILSEPCEKESDLHYAIIAECKNRGWIYFHGSMAHNTHRTVGEMDFCCLLPNGVVVFVECKSKTGKVSPQQFGMKLWMDKLGHTMHIVRSLEDFLKACEAEINTMANHIRSKLKATTKPNQPQS